MLGCPRGMAGTVAAFLDFFIWLCGALTAVTTACHFLADKDRLNARRNRFDGFVYKFANVTWPRFARMEASAAVSVLDRFAGPKLFSWKRLLSVLLLLFLFLLVAVATAGPPLGELFQTPDGFTLVTRLRYALGLGLSLAVAITVTRRISIFILQLPATRTISVAAFGLLLLVHLLLLVVWYPVYVATLTYLEVLFDAAQRAIFNRQPFPDIPWLGLISDILRSTPLLLTPFSRWMDACLPHKTGNWDQIQLCMETSADSAVQGARIAFALTFLLAFLLVPPLKDVLIKLIKQSKPIIPMLLGSLTAAALLVQKGLSFI
jgi:hypothetical protein